MSAVPDRYRCSGPEELPLCLLADVLDPPALEAPRRRPAHLGRRAAVHPPAARPGGDLFT